MKFGKFKLEDYNCLQNLERLSINELNVHNQFSSYGRVTKNY